MALLTTYVGPVYKHKEKNDAIMLSIYAHNIHEWLFQKSDDIILSNTYLMRGNRKLEGTEKKEKPSQMIFL